MPPGLVSEQDAQNVPLKVLEKKLNQFGGMWSCIIDEQNDVRLFAVSLHLDSPPQEDDGIEMSLLVNSLTLLLAFR